MMLNQHSSFGQKSAGGNVQAAGVRRHGLVVSAAVLHAPHRFEIGHCAALYTGHPVPLALFGQYGWVVVGHV
jgi:hypothetical protein